MLSRTKKAVEGSNSFFCREVIFNLSLRLISRLALLPRPAGEIGIAQQISFLA